MKHRIITTLFLWAALLSLVLFGKTPMAMLLITAFTWLTLWEFYGMLESWKRPAKPILGIFLSTFILLGPVVTKSVNSSGDFLILSLIVCSFYLIYRNRKIEDLSYLMPTLCGLLFIAFPFSYMIRCLQTFPNHFEGIFIVFWIIAVAKFTDVGALLIGIKFGRKKFAPHISPKKTWEGVSGGLLTALILGMLLPWIGKAYWPVSLNPIKTSMAALLVGISGITADLLESSLKRMTGIKDSGTIIPGIGGVCDLTDSLVLAAPMGWFCLTVILA